MSAGGIVYVLYPDDSAVSVKEVKCVYGKEASERKQGGGGCRYMLGVEMLIWQAECWQARRVGGQ